MTTTTAATQPHTDPCPHAETPAAPITSPSAGPSAATAAGAAVESVHGDLDCAVTEALLADVTADNARLAEENMNLRRRLDIVMAQKHLAINEAVAARSRT